MRTIDSTGVDRTAENHSSARETRHAREDGSWTRIVRRISSIVFFGSILCFVVFALGAIWGVIADQVFIWRALTSIGVLLASSGMALAVLKQLEPRR